MLRTYVIGKAVADCARAFVSRHSSILAGDYHGELVKDSASAGVIQAFKNVDAKLFYAADANLRLELMGRRVISDLLSAFFEGALEYEGSAPKTKSFPGKLYRLMSANYRNVFEKAALSPSSQTTWPRLPSMVYPKLQLVTDYICGMTDSFACSLHQQLTHG
jgi:dGTPase